MRTTLMIAGGCIGVLLMACNNAKSPDAVAKDVASAEQKGAAEVAKSEEAATKDLDKAAARVDDKVVTFNNQAAQDAYNIAVAKADADRRVTEANCNGLAGSAQKNCKDQAEADYSAAKADAKAAAQAMKD
jgi:hypothetical protein